MDRIITICRFQWRAFWRRFRRAGHLSAGNQGVLLIFSVLILSRYLQALHKAAIDLPLGNTRVFESLLLAIFLAWMFPLASSAGTLTSIRKLQRLPLTSLELFTIRAIGLFFPPYSWVVLAGSLAICYPVIGARNPVAGLVAALIFIVLSALTGLTIASLLSIKIFRRVFFVVLIGFGLGMFYLMDGNWAMSPISLSPMLPSSLVIRAATGSHGWIAVGELAAFAIVALIASLWSFKRSLEVARKPRSKKVSIFDSFRLPGPAGGLAAKDFRYFRKLLDPYLGVLAAALGSFCFIVADVASAGFYQAFLMAVFVPNASLAFNLFGLDNRAVMDRVRLMPLTGRTILLGKNLAFMMIVSLQLAPLVLLAGWRLGPLIAAIGVAEAAAMAAMYLGWGNWISVYHPLKMQFFQFSPPNGLVMEALTGVIFGSLPGLMGIYFLHTSGFAAAWKITVVLVVSGLIYAVSLWHAGNSYPAKQDTILAALS